MAEKYAYLVNIRGRAVRVPINKSTHLLSQGYKQITKDQFQQKSYYPEFDKGEQSKQTKVFATSPEVKSKDVGDVFATKEV